MSSSNNAPQQNQLCQRNDAEYTLTPLTPCRLPRPDAGLSQWQGNAPFYMPPYWSNHQPTAPFSQTLSSIDYVYHQRNQSIRPPNFQGNTVRRDYRPAGLQPMNGANWTYNNQPNSVAAGRTNHQPPQLEPRPNGEESPFRPIAYPTLGSVVERALQPIISPESTPPQASSSVYSPLAIRGGLAPGNASRQPGPGLIATPSKHPGLAKPVSLLGVEGGAPGGGSLDRSQRAFGYKRPPILVDQLPMCLMAGSSRIASHSLSREEPSAFTPIARSNQSPPLKSTVITLDSAPPTPEELVVGDGGPPVLNKISPSPVKTSPNQIKIKSEEFPVEKVLGYSHSKGIHNFKVQFKGEVKSAAKWYGHVDVVGCVEAWELLIKNFNKLVEKNKQLEEEIKELREQRLQRENQDGDNQKPKRKPPRQRS